MNLHPDVPKPQLTAEAARKVVSKLPADPRLAAVGMNDRGRWQNYYGDRKKEWIGPSYDTSADALLVCRYLNERLLTELYGTAALTSDYEHVRRIPKAKAS